MTIISQKTPLAPCNLVLQQRQHFLSNLSARIPITPKHQGTHEVRDEVLSIVGAQMMETMQVSNAWSARHRVSLGVSWLEHRISFWTSHRHNLFPNSVWLVSYRFSGWKHKAHWRGGKYWKLTTQSLSDPISHLLRIRPFVTKTENFPDYIQGSLLNDYKQQGVCDFMKTFI